MSALAKDAGAVAAWVRLGVAVAVGLSLDRLPAWGGAVALVACVWLDALAGYGLRRWGTESTRAREGAELLADFGCFALLPAAWALRLNGESLALRIACAGFVLAAVVRLVRFHAEGLVAGKYRGLPTTYCGYAVPILAGVIYLAGLPAVPTWIVGLAGLAWAMNSGRLRVPEF